MTDQDKQAVLDALAACEKVLCNQQRPEAAVALWQVLTALRGPDSNDCELKASTTAPLRGRIFPGMLKDTYVGYGAYSYFGRRIMVAQPDKWRKVYRINPQCSEHFTTHCRLANCALLDLGR